VKPAGPEPERFGPLTVTRYVKEDARALILFGRAEPAAEPDA
jgi:hypothetical protein